MQTKFNKPRIKKTRKTRKNRKNKKYTSIYGGAASTTNTENNIVGLKTRETGFNKVLMFISITGTNDAKYSIESYNYNNFKLKNRMIDIMEVTNKTTGEKSMVNIKSISCIDEETESIIVLNSNDSYTFMTVVRENTKKQQNNEIALKKQQNNFDQESKFKEAEEGRKKMGYFNRTRPGNH